MRRSWKAPTAVRALRLTKQTRGGSAQVARLSRPGPDPRRVLLVADSRTTTVPQGTGGAVFAEALLERLWLLDQRGIDLDVLQGRWRSLRGLREQSARRLLAPYSDVVAILDRAAPSLGPLAAGRLAWSRLATGAGVTPWIIDIGERRGRPARHDSPASDEGLQPEHQIQDLHSTDPGFAARLADALHADDSGAPRHEEPTEVVDDGLEGLRDIAGLLRSAFDVDQVTIDLSGHGRLRTLVSDGLDLAPAAALQLWSMRTAQRGHLLVVPDTDRCTDRPVALRRVAFYVGQPLRSSAGSLVGTVNVYDRSARPGGDVDAQLLSDFVLLIEGEVALHQSEHASRPTGRDQ